VQVGDARPLLMAKLVVPELPSTTVARSRLQNQMSGQSGVRLTTVVAPAGWGKTTMLAAWAHDPRWNARVAWLSLDKADDEPVRFWTYALSALGRVAPSLTQECLATLSAPGMDPVGVALSALLNALTVSEERYVLVLDDFHLLRDPNIHQGVEFLLTYLPPALHLVVASRADPPLPLARMRARGHLREIRSEDLRCTDAEGVELLTEVGGMSMLPAQAGARIVERTEGWPAALQLAALALRKSGDPDAVTAQLRGDGRHVLDYFAAEVLPGLEGRERDLLVRSSVLERLSGPLCDAVLGTDGAHQVLEQLERAGLFVSALGGGWYRCHHLFREVLRRELDEDPTDAPSVLLSRAADWFLSEGRLEEAIEHRLAAGDYAGAFDWLLEGERWFMDRGATAAFLRLGELLAATVTDPRLFVTLAIAAGESGRAERCAYWLEAAEPLIDAGSDPLPGWRTLRAEADTVWATFRAAGDAEAALRYASRAVELEDDPTLYGHALARQALGAALAGAGRVAEGIEMLQDCWRSRGRRDLPLLLVLQQAGQLALVLIEVGDLEGARRIAREVHDLATAAEQAWSKGAAPALAGLRLAEARIVMANDPGAAIPALQRAADLADGWGWATLLLLALAELAAAHWAVGDRPEARLNLARAREVADTGEARPAAVRRLEALEARVGRTAVATARAGGALAEELTDRELAILRALRGPLTAREIGAEMYLSVNTVKGYTKSLYRKLGVVTRADAVSRGHHLGLI
jgi:LuxR family maltose regulon positive regulatory protein